MTKVGREGEDECYRYVIFTLTKGAMHWERLSIKYTKYVFSLDYSNESSFSWKVSLYICVFKRYLQAFFSK